MQNEGWPRLMCCHSLCEPVYVGTNRCVCVCVCPGECFTVAQTKVNKQDSVGGWPLRPPGARWPRVTLSRKGGKRDSVLLSVSAWRHLKSIFSLYFLTGGGENGILRDGKGDFVCGLFYRVFITLIYYTFIYFTCVVCVFIEFFISAQKHNSCAVWGAEALFVLIWWICFRESQFEQIILLDGGGRL